MLKKSFISKDKKKDADMKSFWSKIMAIITGIFSANLVSTLQVYAAGKTVKTPIDPNFGMPIPPVNAPYGLETTMYAEWILFAIGIIVIALVLYDSIKNKVILPIVLTLSGTVCTIPEVYFDVNGACFWPATQESTVYTLMGRPMTWYPVIAWFAFGAVLLYISYTLIAKQPKTKWIWIAFGLQGIADILFEEVMLNVPGLYVYYGNQPLIVFTKLPWWYIPCNAGGLFLAAALAYRYKEQLRGWKSLAMFFITPMCVAGMYGFIGVPSFIVVNGTYSWWITQLGGLMTIAMGIVAVALIIHLVLQRNPFDFSNAESIKYNNSAVSTK